MNQQRLIDAFSKAIRQPFKPPPLIGQKWFQFEQTSDGRVFRFLGVAKLAKATGKDSEHVVRKIIQNLCLAGAKIESTDTVIQVTFGAEKASPKENEDGHTSGD